jgi:hypothetical protein
MSTQSSALTTVCEKGETMKRPAGSIAELRPTLVIGIGGTGYLLKNDRYRGGIMQLCAPGALFVGVAPQNVRSALGRSAR